MRSTMQQTPSSTARLVRRGTCASGTGDGFREATHAQLMSRPPTPAADLSALKVSRVP